MHARSSYTHNAAVNGMTCVTYHSDLSPSMEAQRERVARKTPYSAALYLPIPANEPRTNDDVSRTWVGAWMSLDAAR
jgi:hypothetical protein